ncbi:hypothetical protein [Altibacter sp. HG106]|uniref:hypothetical protein n=1 Tax=Altibacter sp. HG106 TaxID=3023937 RepID=UPI002350C789|nr:hypothetical protein [Altibacter sp. HG106]MDC7995935.1 hypothetical protein [Altibacter sp. HG106]
MKNAFAIVILLILALNGCSPEQEHRTTLLPEERENVQLSAQEIQLASEAIVKAVMDSDCH